MKKILLILSTVLLVASCESQEFRDETYSLGWRVRNFTEQTLILKCPAARTLDSDNLEYRDFEIESFGRVTVCYVHVDMRKQKKLGFDDYFKKCAEKFGEDVSWQILSEGGEVLKEWKYSERNLPEQRFFDIAEWDAPPESWSGLREFGVLPEDIVLEK